MTFHPTAAPDFGRVRWANADGSAGQVLDGCELYAVHVDGREAAHVALRRLAADCVEITALQTTDPALPIAGETMRLIEHAIAAPRLQAITARPGVARLMQRQGWACTGYIMQKDNHGRPQ